MQINENFNNRKTLFIVIGFALLLCCFMFAAKQLHMQATYNVYSPKHAMVDTIRLHRGVKIEQPITNTGQLDNINAISLLFVVNNNVLAVKQGEVTVSLLENDKVIQTWKQDTRFLRNNVYSTYKLSNTSILNPSKKYSLLVEQVVEGNNGVGVAIGRASKESYIKIGKEGKKGSFSLCYRTISSKLSNKFLLTVIALSFLFFLSLAMLFENFKNIFRDITNDGYKQFKLFSIFLLLFMSTFFAHGDGMAITNWAVKLLESVQLGSYRDYATIISEKTDLTCNYNIIVNIFNAMLLAPLYIIHRIFDMKIHISFFNFWRVFCSVAFVLITSIYLEKIALNLNYNTVFSKWFGLLYLLSPALLWGSIGMGQIDCIEVLFLVITFYYIINDKFTTGFFWLGAASVVKEFAILFFFIPWVCLLIGQCKIKAVLKCLVAYSVLPLFSFILSHLVFINYSALQSMAGLAWGHLSRLFNTQWEGTSFFLMTLFVICLLCIHKAVSNKVVVRDFVFTSLFTIAAFHFFVGLNPQWEIYILLALMMGLLFADSLGFLALILSQIGFYLYTFFKFPYNVDNTMIQQGIMRNIFNLQHILSLEDYAGRFLPDYTVYLHSLGKTLTSAALCFMLYLFYDKLKRSGHLDFGKYLDSIKPIMLTAISFVFMNMIVILVCFISYFSLIRV